MGRWGYKGEGMKDQEIRDAVENIAGYLEHDSLFGEYEKNALPTLLNLAQQYLSIKGMPEEISYLDETIMEGTIDNIRTNEDRRTHNNILKECKFAMMKRQRKTLEALKSVRMLNLKSYEKGTIGNMVHLKIGEAIHNLGEKE